MYIEKQLVIASKRLSLVLRHQPETLGITLDEQGWTSVDILLQKAKEHSLRLDLDLLRHIVETNSKKRFAFNADETLIRASQGHSVEVELGYEAQEPPQYLYHGTHDTAVESILKTGIEKRNRHHVHLSPDLSTAIQVGQRRGKAVILRVNAGEMHANGIPFFRSDNGVWLVDFVPAGYVARMD